MSKKKNKSEILCQICLNDYEESFMVPTGRVFMTDPIKKEYKCTDCGYKTIVAVDKIKSEN